MDTFSRFSSKNSASMISADLSEAGKTRLPRSTFSLTPSSSKNASTQAGGVRSRALQRNFPFRGVAARTSSGEQWLVTLHRPLPVMYSFRPTFWLRSMRVTAAPCRAAQMAAIMPAAPPPTTTISGRFIRAPSRRRCTRPRSSPAYGTCGPHPHFSAGLPPPAGRSPGTAGPPGSPQRRPCHCGPSGYSWK